MHLHRRNAFTHTQSCAYKQAHSPPCLKLLCVCVQHITANYWNLSRWPPLAVDNFTLPSKASDPCGVMNAFTGAHCLSLCFACLSCVLHVCVCVCIQECATVRQRLQRQSFCSSLISMTLVVVIRGIIALQDSCLTWGVQTCCSVSVRFCFCRGKHADCPLNAPIIHLHVAIQHVCRHTAHTHTHFSLYCSTCPHFCAFLTLSHTNFSPLLLTSEPTL